MNFLSKLFFPKTINNYISTISDLRKELRYKKNHIDSIEKEVEIEKRTNHSILKLLKNEIKDYTCLEAFDVDKNGDYCFVIDTRGTMLHVYQLNKRFSDFEYASNLHINYKIMIDSLATMNSHIFYIDLQDIQNIEKNANKGLGTIAIEELIKIAIRSKCKSIKGKLSPVDKDDKERRFHFYKKYGFVIDGNSNDANICLEITDEIIKKYNISDYFF